MKKPSDALFMLVHGMSSKEKQYFKQVVIVKEFR